MKPTHTDCTEPTPAGNVRTYDDPRVALGRARDEAARAGIPTGDQGAWLGEAITMKTVEDYYGALSCKFVLDLDHLARLIEEHKPMDKATLLQAVEVIERGLTSARNIGHSPTYVNGMRHAASLLRVAADAL